MPSLDKEGYFINYSENNGHHYFEIKKEISSWDVLKEVTYEIKEGTLYLTGTVEQYHHKWYEALTKEQYSKYQEKYEIDHYYEISRLEKFFGKYRAINGWFKLRNKKEKIELKTSSFTIKECENT